MRRPTIYLIANLSSYYGVGMPIALFLAFRAHLGVPGMWMGLFCAQLVQAALVTIVIARTDWRLQAMKAQELTYAHDKDGFSEGAVEQDKREMADLEEHDIEDIYGLDED
jgi:hypothetical protein